MRLWSRSDFDPRTDSFGGGEDGLLFGDFSEDVVVEDSEEDVEICVLSSCLRRFFEYYLMKYVYSSVI